MLLLAVVPAAHAAAPQSGPPITIQRAAGAITVDGDLTDAGWQGIPGITQWYETRVGDNVEPQVKNVGFLAYDERYLYAAFQFDDPQPNLIRAPVADHDQLSGSTDYGGVIVDSRNDGKSAILFLANANGLTYDAVSNDASGEDSAPDFYWESAGKVTPTGWQLEIRIPFTSLRYSKDNQPTWGVMLYRNYPRDRHYQFFSARLPRDVNCFICNESKMTGLVDLPHGSHLVMAPYATAQRLDEPTRAAPSTPPQFGTPLESGDMDSRFGLDVKWSPLANAAIDATINPDFSQVEGDVAQIGANERFALSYPEKRSFFIEGIDLFSTPFTALYTRSITDPSGGVRTTGRAGNTSFTVLGARDRGQGFAIIPGPQGSDVGFQDFESDVGVMRVRHDLGRSFVSVLGTARIVDGGGNNFVFGPDFEWRPRGTDTFTGQALWSHSETPDRSASPPGEFPAEWDGRKLDDRALLARWSHSTARVDVFAQGQDLGPDFRADNGFISQVGYREMYFENGYTVRPKNSFFSRIRMFTVDWYDADYDGNRLSQRVSAGAGMDGRWNSFVRFEVNRDDFLVGTQQLGRWRPYVTVQSSPGRVLNNVSVEAYLGQEVDFANAREGTGTTLIASATVRPHDKLEFRGNYSARWLNVDDPALGKGRLFLAQVERLRVSYAFSSRMFLRLIGQYTPTRRNPSLYTFPVNANSESFNGSALFSYKLNWQTVLYLGYGDDRQFVTANDKIVPVGRQAFAKISYAIQQ